MASNDEKVAERKCPFDSAKHSKSGSVSDLSHVQVNSATVYLLKKAASGIPQVANLFWGMLQEFGIQDFDWDGDMFGEIEGVNAQTPAEVGSMTNDVLSSTFSPYFYSVSNAFGDGHSPDTPSPDNDLPPVTSVISDSSSCEQNMQDTQGGLVFQSTDFNNDEGTERLDYVITQVDVSRMTRTASRRLNVESIHQLPTVTYHAESALICSSHEEENIDDFLLRNARIIEDYFDNTEENVDSESEREDLENLPSEFSWMMVPEDPTGDKITRIPNSIRAGEVPDSISICKSCNDSVNGEFNLDDDTCVVCEKPFQDGECLRVLSCQHLFHSSCIDKWISGVISECPKCKKTPRATLPQQGVFDDYDQVA